MEKQYKIKKSVFHLICILLVSCSFIACSNDDVDDEYSKNKYNLEILASANSVILNEDALDDIALTLDWTPAIDWGTEYMVYYNLEINLVGDGSTNTNPIKQYVDDVTTVSFTHRELQDMLINNWSQSTSSNASLRFTLIANFEGPRIVIPETSTIDVKFKTYGPIQFKADKLFMTGTAVGQDEIEILSSAKNPKIYVYTGELSAGTINFPVIYGDEVRENSIGAVSPNLEITNQAMDAIIASKASSNVWVVKNADTYRVTVNFETQTVSILSEGDIIEIEKLYLAGSAVGEEIELIQTLEDESCYAFRGELKAGSLYLPILFDGTRSLSIVPVGGGSQNINDGNSVAFTQVDTEEAESTNYWNIATAGTYRVVVNIDTKEITIYSPVTDLKSKEVSWNNTVTGQNPFWSKVEKLWMYGGFNGSKFNDNHVLTQSQANPYIFVYQGDALAAGGIRFAISNIASNVYAYGGTTIGGSNGNEKYEDVVLNIPMTVVAGQGVNRYAYFRMPAGVNYMIVDIDKLTVFFGQK